MLKKIVRFLVYLGVAVGLLGTIAAALVGSYFYIRLTRDLPQIESLKDYRPNAVSAVYSADGALIAEVFDQGGKRYPVQFKDIPLRVRNAFLAAEDADFYHHPGIDPVSIIRAVLKNLMRKKVRQGASTITQQTVKSLLLTRERSFERKAKEAILSYRLEKYLTKDEIFSIYLNEIFLGSGASGIKAAARVHFHKELDQLSIAEAAYLAGLPQRPSELTNPKNRKEAIDRQRYVIRQMVQHGMITTAEGEAAREEPLTIYHQEEQTIFAAPYYASYVINDVLPEVFKKIGPYVSASSPGGYSIETSVDLKATDTAIRALQKGLREVDKRRGWRGPLGRANGEANGSSEKVLTPSDLEPNHLYRAVVERVGPEAGTVTVRVGAVEGKVDFKKAPWAKRYLKDDVPQGVEPIRLVQANDILEVSYEVPKPAGDSEKSEKKEVKNDLVNFSLDQTPQLEGAFFLANALTGEIKTMVGGYDYKRSQFNRVVQARRQPGSSFKPFVYLSAVESLGYTPSTIVPDEPISLPAGNGELWTPGNFDGKFLGPITMRTALQRSRNVVSVFLVEKMGVEKIIQTAHRLGITTDIPPNLSIALGTAEINMLELVRAYGAFASGGWLAEPLVVKRIKDRDGKVIYEQEPHGHRVIDEDSAFLMANMMKGVVERGTATVLKALEKPMAGKTGTTNDQMDAWFIGYTPEWVGGVWVGFDQKKMIGGKETGGKVAAPIMLYFMQEFLAKTPPLDFLVSDGVIPVSVDLNSGHPVPADSLGAFVEYFKSGTEPQMASEPEEWPEGQSEEGDSEAEPKKGGYLSGNEF